MLIHAFLHKGLHTIDTNKNMAPSSIPPKRQKTFAPLNYGSAMRLNTDA